MGVIEQGQLRITGIPCEGAPFQLKLSQGFNRHGVMEAGVWVLEEERSRIEIGQQVRLEGEGEEGGPMFCGIITRVLSEWEKGRSCAYLQVMTESIRMDRKKTEPLLPKAEPQL